MFRSMRCVSSRNQEIQGGRKRESRSTGTSKLRCPKTFGSWRPQRSHERPGNVLCPGRVSRGISTARKKGQPTGSRKRGERGHGIARQYTFADLVICRVVQRLAASGVSPLKVKSAIRELHSMGISLNRLPSARVVIFGKSVYVWSDSSDPFRVTDGQQAFGFILDLQLISQEIKKDLEKIAA